MTNTFIYRGFSFSYDIDYDCDTGLPWDDEGRGIVSDWTRRDKRPGEKVLCVDQRLKRYYDVKATTKKAKKEAWGLSDDEIESLKARLGRTPTRKELTAQAVENDFNWIKRYCDDMWWYAVVHVELRIGNEKYETYLGSVEYDPWNTSAQELVTEYCEGMASDLIYEYMNAHAFELKQNLYTTLPRELLNENRMAV